MTEIVKIDAKALERIQEDLLWIKFSIPELRTKLLETDDAELIEGNTWGDTYWGTCSGIGQNHLGKLLMKTRFKIRAQIHV